MAKISALLFPSITYFLRLHYFRYINGLLIPEIHVVRGRTYTFVVEGGDDPEFAAGPMHQLLTLFYIFFWGGMKKAQIYYEWCSPLSLSLSPSLPLLIPP